MKKAGQTPLFRNYEEVIKASVAKKLPQPSEKQKKQREIRRKIEQLEEEKQLKAQTDWL